METMTNTKQQHYSHKIGDELAHFLADTYTLYLKTQNFHWNVVGPNFHSYHLLFEEQYKELADANDVIAERMRAVKSHVPASFAHFMKLTSIKEENGTPGPKDMIKQLVKDNEIVTQHAYIILSMAQKAHDEGTMDLMIERIRAHEKAAWMLRSHLE